MARFTSAPRRACHDSSINFEARFFLADITAQLAVTNEIKFRIYERFKEEGISIPFPQRDINLAPELMEALKGMAAPDRNPDGDHDKNPAKEPAKEADTASEPARRPRRSGRAKPAGSKSDSGA